MAPLLELAQVPVDGIPSFSCVNCITQVGGVGKCIEGSLHPSVSLRKTLMSTGPSTDP